MKQTKKKYCAWESSTTLYIGSNINKNILITITAFPFCNIIMLMKQIETNKIMTNSTN